MEAVKKVAEVAKTCPSDKCCSQNTSKNKIGGLWYI